MTRLEALKKAEEIAGEKFDKDVQFLKAHIASNDGADVYDAAFEVAQKSGKVYRNAVQRRMEWELSPR